jgi:hypothetical protein
MLSLYSLLALFSVIQYPPNVGFSLFSVQEKALSGNRRGAVGGMEIYRKYIGHRHDIMIQILSKNRSNLNSRFIRYRNTKLQQNLLEPLIGFGDQNTIIRNSRLNYYHQ